MINIMIGIILAPFALLAAFFTLCFGYGVIAGVIQSIRGEKRNK